MGETRAWIIPIFFGLLVLVAVIPYISRMRRRKRFSNGVDETKDGVKYYQTPASWEQIIAALSEYNKTDCLVYMFDAASSVITVQKEHGELWSKGEAVYQVKADSSDLQSTVFTVIADPKSDHTRYDGFLNEFFAEKVNALRISPPKE